MEPLVTNRRYLVWLCVCPADEFANRWQKLVYTILAVYVLSTIMCGVTGCLTYCWKFASIDFGRSVFAFMFAVAEFTVVYMALVGIILLRHKIGSIFDKLSAIYRQSKCLTKLNLKNLKKLLLFLQFRWKYGLIRLFGTCEWRQRTDVEKLFQDCLFDDHRQFRFGSNHFCSLHLVQKQEFKRRQVFPSPSICVSVEV